MGSSIEKNSDSNSPSRSTVGVGVSSSAAEFKEDSDNSCGISSSGISSSAFSVDEDKISNCSSTTLSGWSIQKPDAVPAPRHSVSEQSKPNLNGGCNSRPLKQSSKCSEMEMMKERFAKLLLGEDMSGSGKGVSSALAISNAITNLCATVFGQLWRLEPLPTEKKSMWRREMEWFICVCNHIVEFIPSWQTFPDGSKLEIMTCRPRSDLFINLPALRKLDNLLIEILDGFSSTEFWYVDQGIVASDSDGSSSFRKTLLRQEEKWWLPVPRLPPGGLQECSRKHLDHKRECTNQILKAAVSINGLVLSEMEVPDSFLETLPKSGRACLGDLTYRYITSNQFSPERVLDCLDLTTEHVALEIANRVEAAIYVWRRGPQTKSTIMTSNTNRSATKSSWGMVRDLMVDGGTDNKRVLAERAERLLLCLKQRFPGLTQTTLDTAKIQCNTDVGKSILESYSRVLESIASNIVARIDDVLYVDDLTKQSDKSSMGGGGPPGPTVSVFAHKKTKGLMPYSGSVSSTPHRAATTFSGTPNTVSVVSRAGSGGDRTPLVNKPPRPGGGGRVRRVLTNYLTGDSRIKNCGNQLNEGLGSGRLVSKCVTGSPSSPRTDAENIDPQRVSSMSSSEVLKPKTCKMR